MWGRTNNYSCKYRIERIALPVEARRWVLNFKKEKEKDAD